MISRNALLSGAGALVLMAPVEAKADAGNVIAGLLGTALIIIAILAVLGHVSRRSGPSAR